MPTGQQYATGAAQENLTSNITAASLFLNLTGTTGFPSTPFTVVVDIGEPTQEAMDVTNVSGNVATVTRGVDGTSAQNHSNNATVTHVAIGRDFREARSHMDASGTGGGTTVHGLQAGSVVVGTTDTQTLTNKTFTSPSFVTPSIASATITGTVSGSATYQTITATSPTITGTVTGAATYDNVTVATTAVGTVPLTVNSLANQTADILDVEANGTKVLTVSANGATGAGAVTISPTDTASAALTVNAPNTSAGNIITAQINAVTKMALTNAGQLSLTPGPLSVAGITGAVTASRYVGGTAGGPPTTGTFAVGDHVIDTLNGMVWVCVTLGTPGKWAPSGAIFLGSTTLAANQASISISIPSYVNNIMGFFNGRQNNGSGGEVAFARFNADSGSNYVWQTLWGSIAAVTATNPGATGTGIDLCVIPGSSDTANYFGSCNFVATNIQSAVFKPLTSQYNGMVSTTEGYSGTGGGLWTSTAAVTAVAVFPSSGNLVTGSSLSVWGWI